MLFLTVRRDVERGEERFAAVLCTRQEIDDELLLLDDPVLLLLDVRDALPLEDALPVALRHLDVVFERSRVLQLCLLRHPDKLLDVVPIPLEECSVIRDRIIRTVRSRHTTDHRELPARRLLLHPLLQIPPRVVERKQRNLLHLIDGCQGLVPVGI